MSGSVGPSWWVTLLLAAGETVKAIVVAATGPQSIAARVTVWSIDTIEWTIHESNNGASRVAIAEGFLDRAVDLAQELKVGV